MSFVCFWFGIGDHTVRATKNIFHASATLVKLKLYWAPGISLNRKYCLITDTISSKSDVSVQERL